MTDSMPFTVKPAAVFRAVPAYWLAVRMNHVPPAHRYQLLLPISSDGATPSFSPYQARALA
jgi:hypothetical protein